MEWQGAGILLTFILGVWNLVYNLRNSKRTTFINTVTSERVKWIQATRESIAALCGRTYFWVMTSSEISKEESNNIIKEIDELSLLVKLRLNPKSEIDMKLMQLIDEIPKYTDISHEYEMKKLLNSIIENSQYMLKEEWDKVRDESTHGDLREKGKFFKI